MSRLVVQILDGVEEGNGHEARIGFGVVPLSDDRVEKLRTAQERCEDRDSDLWRASLPHGLCCAAIPGVVLALPWCGAKASQELGRVLRRR